MPRRAPVSKASAFAFALLSVVLVGSLWIIPYLPTNDGPESILAVHMENHYGDPGTIYREVFRPAPQFAGRGFTILFEPLEETLGWQRGLQVALTVDVLVCAWGFVALVRALEPGRLPLAFFGFPLALSWSLYMGFFAFVLSGGVGLYLIAASLGPPSTARRALLAALLLLQAGLHMFPAILTGLVIAALLVARAPPGERLRELGRAALIGVPAAALVLAAFLVARRTAATVPFSGQATFLPPAETLAVWPRTLAPGPLARALLVTLGIVGCASVACARALRHEATPTDRVLAIGAVLLLVASLVTPRDIPGWQCFSERFVWLGALLAVAAVPVERLPSPRAARAVSLGCFVGALAWLALTYPLHRRLASASADVVAGLSAPVVRHGLWLPVTLEPAGPPMTTLGQAEVPLLAPLRHIGALYATVEGGLLPYTFASNPATWPFALRPDAPSPPPVPDVEHYFALLGAPEFQTNRALRHVEENELATFGMFYEGVLLTGARPDDLALWHRRGYVADWEQGSVMVGRFVPCAIDVALRDGAEREGAPLLDVGVGEKVVLRDVARPVLAADDGSRHVRVDDGPCGHVWVRPHWARTESASRPALCGNAGADGKLRALVARTAGEVACSGVRLPDAPAAP